MLQRTVVSRMPFDRPSVCQTRGLWQNESKFCPPSYTTWKTIHPSFLVDRDEPFYRYFRSNWPRWSENADPIFNRYSPVAPQLGRNTYRKKVQLTLIGSPLRAFQWAQDEQCALSLSPSQGSHKRKVSKSRTVICDNFETVRNGKSASRKSHTAFDWYRHRWPWIVFQLYFAITDLRSSRTVYLLLIFSSFSEKPTDTDD